MTRLTQAALALSVLIGIPVLAVPSTAAAASPLFVDVNDATCSDTGPGTTTNPFCHIGAALRVAGPGDTVSVASGKYREQVVFPRSGLPGAPITLEATTTGVTVLGSLNVSEPAAWTQRTGSTWSRPFARTARQVLVDGKRLSAAADLAGVVPGSFWYDTAAKVLYVDLGAGNPGDGHVVEAGAESSGLIVSGRTDVVVKDINTANQNYYGVQVVGSSGVRLVRVGATYTGSYGIRVESSSNVEVLDCEVRRAGSHGILLKASSAVLVGGCATSDNLLHGIALQSTSDSVLRSNRSWNNAKPGSRISNGIDVNVGSSRNLIEFNRLWQNQDSGLQLYNGANDNMVRRNVSYGNGDHGFDTYNATGATYLNNTAYNNRMDGYSIEGSASNTVTINNIAADNGEFELYVDRSSAGTWVGDRDLFWRSAGTVPIKVNGIKYLDTPALSAGTGQERRGLWGDPRFRDLSLPDLRLTSASPAVDSADASAAGFQLIDLDGALPFDVPQVSNTGVGPPNYVDRGAWEFLP